MPWPQLTLPAPAPSHLELHLGPWDYTPFLDHNELECFLKQVKFFNQGYLTSTIPLTSHWSAQTKGTQSLPFRSSLWQSDHAFLLLINPTRLLDALLQLSSLPPHLPPLSLWWLLTWTISEAHWLFLKEMGPSKASSCTATSGGSFKSPSYYLIRTAEL